MKVIITNKGEGFLDARFEATTGVETLILAQAAVEPVTASLSIYSSDGGKAFITVGSCVLKVLDIVSP